ncbi:hypothetical protein B0H11DRAFT_2343031 [Mycena galericulata]|nr:hypothetical protein B0H11DRAFT_2343031 [Mycena galericulata]
MHKKLFAKSRASTLSQMRHAGTTAAPKTQDEARHLTGQILASTVTVPIGRASPSAYGQPADDPTTGINTQLTALLSLARPLMCNALLASVPSLGTLAFAPPAIMRLYQVLKVTFDPFPSTPKSRRAVLSRRLSQLAQVGTDTRRWRRTSCFTAARPPWSCAADNDNDDNDDTAPKPAGGHLTPAEEAHYTHAYSAAELRTFHCERVCKMPLSRLDSSMLIGFVCRDEGEWVDLRRKVGELPCTRRAPDMARRGRHRRYGARERLGCGGRGRRRRRVEHVTRRVDIFAWVFSHTHTHSNSVQFHLHHEQQRAQRRGRHGGGRHGAYHPAHAPDARRPPAFPNVVAGCRRVHAMAAADLAMRAIPMERGARGAGGGEAVTAQEAERDRERRHCTEGSNDSSEGTSRTSDTNPVLSTSTCDNAEPTTTRTHTESRFGVVAKIHLGNFYRFIKFLYLFGTVNSCVEN